MKETHYKSWIEKFGVTAPIKNIMSCVDTLEESYERRLAAMHAEYQQDVEAIIDCYKEEKQRFLNLNLEHEAHIKFLETSLEESQRIYKAEKIEHEITHEALQSTRSEIAVLSDALKSEQELIAITKQRIKMAEEQVQLQLASKPIEKSRSFFMQVFESRSRTDATDPEQKNNAQKNDPLIDIN